MIYAALSNKVPRRPDANNFEPNPNKSLKLSLLKALTENGETGRQEQKIQINNVFADCFIICCQTRLQTPNPLSARIIAITPPNNVETMFTHACVLKSTLRVKTTTCTNPKALIIKVIENTLVTGTNNG